MLKLHIVNNRKGGVGVVARRLTDIGDDVELMSNLKIKKLYMHKGDIYFHQPRSHALCLLYSIFIFWKRRSFVCVLHESQDYNFGISSFWRAMLGSLIRRLVIKLLVSINVKLVGVSKYVISSYNLNNAEIFKVFQLFESDVRLVQGLRRKASFNDQKKLVVWVRPGHSRIAIKCMETMVRKELVSKFRIFGDPVEVNIIKNHFKKNNPDFIQTEPNLIERKDFLKLLSNSVWFLSLFEKEGLGLSVFEAMAAGCVCLVAKSGAVIEWLPKENFELFEIITDSNSAITDDQINIVREINMIHASKLIG